MTMGTDYIIQVLDELIQAYSDNYYTNRIAIEEVVRVRIDDMCSNVPNPKDVYIQPLFENR